MKQVFRSFANKTAAVADSPWAFAITVVLALFWLGRGTVFGFSETWQLTMNTAAAQLTSLTAFLLQNTQNRDTRALQLTPDELLRSQEGARPGLMNLEALSDEELEQLQQ